MEKIIAVVSGKGGVGKTTLVSNLGLALKELGEDVIVVDSDLSTSNLGLHLGICNVPVGIQDALKGRIGIRNAILTHDSGLKIIPASVSMEYLYRNTNPYRLKSVLKSLEEYVIIDSPPGLGNEVLMALNACDEVLVVCNPDMPSVTDALKVISLALEREKGIMGIVVNRVSGKHELNENEIEEMCEFPVIGIIPEEKSMKKCIFERLPIVFSKPNSRASIAFRRIAAEIAEIKYKPPRFASVKRFFGR